MTQYLPSGDDFEESNGAITTHPTLWTRVQPWASLTASPAWPWTMSFSYMDFFDRYFGSVKETKVDGNIGVGGVEVGQPPEVARNCVVAYPDVLGVTPAVELHGAAMFRPAEGLNVDLKASFYTLHTAPRGENTYGVGSCGIGARLSGGFNANPAFPNDEWVNSQDGYWFVLGMDSMTALTTGYTGSFDFHLVRVNGGVATVLATEVYDDSSGHFAKLALHEGSPFRLRVTVNTNGSTVEVRCYHTPYYNFGSFRYGVERLAISYDDTHANRIISTGRFGLFNTSEYYDGTDFEFAIPACGYVQANALGGAIIFRDEWKRGYVREAFAVESFVAGNLHCARPDQTFGRSLQSAFTNDNFGHDRQAYTFDTALPGTGVDGIEFDFDVINAVDSGACGQTCISSRPADDPVRQDRSIDFYFDSTGNATDRGLSDDWLYIPTQNSTRSAGIVLRSSNFNHTKYSYPEPQIAYACVFKRDDTAATTGISVYRYTSDGLRTIIAEVVGTPTLALDTWYTARMKIDAIAGPSGTIDDAVEIKVYLDTVQQAFTAEVGGVIVDAGGTIIDESSDRIRSGSGEGFRVNTADNLALGSPRKVYVNNWVQGVDSGPEDAEESDQASVAVGSETDGASGTLTLNAGWPVSVSDTWGRREHRFDYEEYRYANSTMGKPRRVWTIESLAAVQSETDALLVFWNEHHGIARGFTWTTDEGEALIVHFKEHSLGTALRAPGVTAYRIKLEELFDGS